MGSPSNHPVLLIVFGAGASWDVDPLGRYQGIRPPLTRDLFTSGDFVSERAQFSRLAGITRKLVDARQGTSIEQTLADLQVRADQKYAPAARELASVRYYLRDVLKRCTDSALTQLYRATTYAEFVRRVDDWNCDRGRAWRVVLVSFNYVVPAMTSFPSDRSSRPPRHRSHRPSPSASNDRSDDLLADGVTVRGDRSSVELDDELAAPGRERRDDVLVGRAPQPQAVTQDPQLAVLGHPAHPADPATCERQAQLARGVAVRVEREPAGDRPQLAVERAEQRAREARAVRGEGELGVRALVHEPALEATRDPGQTREPRSVEAPQHALLPERVKALDVGVPARLAHGDETHLDPEEERQPHRLGEDPPGRREARDGRLVVDLPDPRQPQARPRAADEMAAEALGALVRSLLGRDAAPGDVDGVKVEEPHRPAPGAQVARPHQVGLLEVARCAGPRIRIRPAAALVRDHRRAGTRAPGAPQDPLDGAPRRHRPDAVDLELPGHRVRAAAGEALPPASARQAVARGEHRAHDALGRRARTMPRGARATPQRRFALGLEAPAPLAQPATRAPQLGADLRDRDAALEHRDRFPARAFLVHLDLPDGVLVPRKVWRRDRPSGRRWERCVGGRDGNDVLSGTHYDTLLEEACADERRMRFDSIDDYIAGDWPVLKPHGSWTWVQEVKDERYPPGTGGSYPTASRDNLIDDFSDLALAERIVVHRAHMSSPDADSIELMDEARTRVPVVPALTIPVMDKSRFVFPDTHLKCLRDACRDTAFLMTIGWHGQEHHFLKELVGAVSSTSMKCLIVTASEPGAQVVQDTLQQHGITADFTQHTGGFGTFLRDPDRLEGLLNAETADR